jgi:hypothetical protein
MATTKTNTTIEIPAITRTETKLYLIGTAPLIVHAWADKSKKEMLDSQTKKAKGPRAKREPQIEWDTARYRLPDGRDGVQAIAFKTAAVTAGTSIADVTKVAARQAFGVKGIPSKAAGAFEGSFTRTALVPLVANEPLFREDTVRIGMGKSDLRYRPEFWPWGVELDIVVNSVISIDQVASLFLAAGIGVGIGDYRPEKNGDCGTFDLATEAEFEEFREYLKTPEALAA